ncbi:MAG TPA: alanine racemase [Mycobacteriales bacterium]|jgi:alanine racemase|nr:alanine racemase [Mycobacteriales bacterium]
MTGFSASARVDLDAVASSVAACAAAAPTAEVMAVVKADGYGHGLLPAARAALAGGASWLGTAQVGEALALRAAGITAPVLTWLNPPGAPLAEAVARGIDVAVSAPWALAEATAGGRVARIHLKIDTGLRRNGAAAADVADLLAATAEAQAAGRIELIGIMTHFVHADSPEHPTTDAQLQCFRAVLAQAARYGLHPQVRHCANSAATLTRPDTHFDLVRPGIACYGLTPVPQLGGPERFGLTPAMSLRATVALTKTAEPGDGVSYGHIWTATESTPLALIPLGYADGVPRAASNVGQVLLGGARRQIAGRVCMDQFVVRTDVSTRAGDEVVVFGSGREGEPTAQEWADWLDTISYEIVTRVGARVPREYVHDLEARRG